MTQRREYIEKARGDIMVLKVHQDPWQTLRSFMCFKKSDILFFRKTIRMMSAFSVLVEITLLTTLNELYNPLIVIEIMWYN